MLLRHSSVWKGLYNPYLWPLVAIWSFDRFLRLVRLAYCNIRIGFSKNMIRLSSSVITYDQEADVIKIVVTPAHTMLKPKPGQFYYIYRPSGWKGWENHPFTLGSFTRPGQQILSPSLSSDGQEWNKEILVSEQRSNQNSSSTSSKNDDTVGTPQQLTFFIRPFDGWTKSFANLCLKDPTGINNSKILIEGPYGHSANLHNYESVLLIAGGTGISAVLPYMEEHMYRQANGLPLRTRQIDLLLTSRNPAFIHALCAKELRPMAGREDTRTSFYSTNSVHSTASEKLNEREETANINTGRPDITNMILEAARVNIAGGSKSGRLAILVCGPAGMADEARVAVERAMKEGCRGIEYIEETFGW